MASLNEIEAQLKRIEEKLDRILGEEKEWNFNHYAHPCGSFKDFSLNGNDSASLLHCSLEKGHVGFHSNGSNVWSEYQTDVRCPSKMSVSQDVFTPFYARCDKKLPHKGDHHNVLFSARWKNAV